MTRSCKDMTADQITACWLLYENGRDSIDEIAKKLGVTRRHVHWALDHLNRRKREARERAQAS